jgi:predicted DNA-binding transcriptional regulator AlpA
MEQLVDLLGFSLRTIKRMTALGQLPGVCRPFGGRAVRYDRKAVQDWISRGCPALRQSRGRK